MSNSSYIEFLNSITKTMNYSFTILSFAVGVPGNIFAAFIFSRLAFIKRRHTNSSQSTSTATTHSSNMGILYTFQCLIDLVILLWISLISRGYLATFFGVAPVATFGNGFCKLSTFMRRAILHFSSWMIVLTTFDRFVSIFYANRYNSFQHHKRKLLILFALIFVTFFIISLLDIPNLFFNLTPNGVCSASYDITLATDMISITLRTYVPLMLIVVFNCKIIFKIRNRRTFSHAASSTSTKTTTSDSRARRDRLFTIAVVSFNLFFFITNFPSTIMYIVYDIKLYSGALAADPLTSAIYSFAFNFILNLSNLTQVLSIFVYFGFNKIFRLEITRLVATCFPCFFAGRSFNQSSTITSRTHHHNKTEES